MKKSSTIVALAVLAMAVLGCRSCDTIDSTKLDPSEINQEYTIAASPEGTSVSATFRAGGPTGTTIELLAPSKVEYNGKAMAANVRTFLNGTYYSAGSDTFSTSNTFVFTDAKGKVFTNRVDLSPVSISSDNITFEHGKPAEIALSRPLANGERAQISLVSDTQPPSSNSFNSNSVGNSSNANSGPPPVDYSRDITPDKGSDATKLVIGPAWLDNFFPGKAKMKVTVTSSPTLQQSGTRGGSISYTINSNEVGVTVVK